MAGLHPLHGGAMAASIHQRPGWLDFTPRVATRSFRDAGTADIYFGRNTKSARKVLRRTSIGWRRADSTSRRLGITPDTALRLGRLFGTGPRIWLDLQVRWDLWHAERSDSAGDIERIEPVEAA